jgi:hypothetical protein
MDVVSFTGAKVEESSGVVASIVVSFPTMTSGESAVASVLMVLHEPVESSIVKVPDEYRISTPP